MIVLRAKNIEFDVTHITHNDKPDWFLEISPHGKVPVLKVGDDVLFESSAIAEYLDEMEAPRLHPEDPVKRARNRAWTDFVPDFSKALGKVTYAKTIEDREEAMAAAAKPLSRLEEALTRERDNDGPYFNGDKISIVDAAYAPFLMRFSIVEKINPSGLMKDYPKLDAWRAALIEAVEVSGSVVPEFEQVFADNLRKRDTLAATVMDSAKAAE